ncbi:hypothetical protein D3C86_1430630 [compost metagenome]
MLGDEVAVGAPVRRQADQGPQTNLVDTGAPQPVRGGEAPLDVLLVAAQVVAGVGGGVIGLLIDHDRIQAQGFQLGVFGLGQRLHLHRQGAEVAADPRQLLTKVVHAHLGLVLAGHQQHAVEAARLEGQALALDLLAIQGLALQAVAHGEAAVGAVVGAQVRQIEGHIETHRIAETLAGEALRQLRHPGQEGLGGR